MSPVSAPLVDVTVVLPVHNEVDHVGEELARIRAAMEASPYSYEVIVVDDGSDDRSSEVLRGVPWIRLIRFDERRGAGAARRVGTQEANGEVVVWSDVDMSYPNDLIPELVGALEGYDQVVGARTSEEGTLKFLRVPAKWFIRRLAQRLSNEKIPDLNSGFRAMRKDVADQFLHLLPDGFSHVTTITLAFLANGYRIRYVDIDYTVRSGSSKFRPVVDTALYLRQVVWMVLRWNPIRVLAPVAAGVLLAGVGSLLSDVVRGSRHSGRKLLPALGTSGMLVTVALVADRVARANRPECLVPPACDAMATSDGPIEPARTTPSVTSEIGRHADR